MLSAFLLIVATATPIAADDFDAWFLIRGRVETLGKPTERLIPVGSLQKPFLARAWAMSHPTAPLPTFSCTRTSGCWRPSGHGLLDMRGAIRESCNSFFKLLARETPQAATQASFRNAGFVWKGELPDDEAIGLPGSADARIEPTRLLASYVDLTRTPWPMRDDVRTELLAGLMDSAQDGTASGLRLWGFRAKTGTVPALDGAPLKTSGFALVLDDAGFAFLGLLRRGTGREAAIRAGVEIAKLRPGVTTRPIAAETKDRNQQARPAMMKTRKRSVEDPVRVEMLSELRFTEIRLKNLSPGPLDSSRGFIGPGATVAASSEDHFAQGLWEIQGSRPAFERRVRASLGVVKVEGAIRLIATMNPRDYANGVLKAELGPSPGTLRTELPAAVLRFLGRGPRHTQADVCDTTHCAWFVGDGPVPRWRRPMTAINDNVAAPELTDTEWSKTLDSAREQTRGPDSWTADCGGDPVSAHFVWGGGDTRVIACSRHRRGVGQVWRREWPAANLASVFGVTPERMDVALVNGQWTLKVRIAASNSNPPTAGPMALTYDEAHRRLATSMGWDALPAPAARITRTPRGFVAEGVGFGHRSGLCLAP